MQQFSRGFTDSTPLLEQPELLKQRAEEDGYLYFSQLIPRERIENVRLDILNIVEEFKWLDSDKAIMAGVAREGIKVMESPSKEWEAFYKRIICLESFNSLGFDERLTDVLKILLGPAVLPHCRKVCRLYSPTAGTYATPPHKDYTWTGGTPDAWTAWLPLGDLEYELGGLQIIAGSHKKNYVAKNGDERQGWIIPEETMWDMKESYSMGDVVIFHSGVLHGGRNNSSNNRIRISADFRYQDANMPIRSDSMCAHWNEKFKMDWTTIYSDWQEDNPHKYYWKKFTNVVSDSDGTFKQDVKKRFILHSIMAAFEKGGNNSEV